MCYNDAAAASAQGIHALRSGILVLAIPPIAIFAIIFGVAYRNRNRYYRAGGQLFARKEELLRRSG